ncbi:hypothetical protein [Geobacter sp. AOG2]|uniref:hypothetical protein n=1 Tax=Geobacter sp. AOG2 TaxID=1566347 RepID=UPI001CC359C5|nr:hypothetical protein [Geobacter sp. AOG2]GFE62154.1 hypothetical protein AOG2_27420 [Geobacter sp. AOG2]
MSRNPISELLETVLLALSATGLWYYCYYLLAPWIWAQNIPFKAEDITPWILSATGEHDGVEIYALYILVFVNIVSAFTLSFFLRHITGSNARRALLCLGVAASASYCLTIGFIPPWNSMEVPTLSDMIFQSLLIILVVSPPTALLYYLNRRFTRWEPLLAALLLVPPCFLAASAFGWRDYTYVFAPALRLLHGAALSDIYFQYDLLPSLLAAGWMKMGLDLAQFRVLGQAAYYLAFLCVYLLSRRLFLKKELSVFLLVALVLGRIYATPFDATLTFQTTPIRLDLWISLLLVVYRLGPYHWAAGLVCGLLMLLLKNFGIIYSAAYIQLIISLWLVGYLGSEQRPPFLKSLLEQLKRAMLPLSILILFGITSYFLFRNTEYGNYAGYYQKIGIGFIQIARDSFYWYVPALFSVSVILLFRLRNQVTPAYLASGFMLTYCAIGDSIYFFGRSHEHNILNIAIVLLFHFFLVLDLTMRVLDNDQTDNVPLSVKKYGGSGIAIALILVIIVSYSDNIVRKGQIQFINVKNTKITYKSIGLPGQFYGFMGKIREVTNNSNKLFFVDKSDFAFYYYGGYAPVGYCNPFETWIFTKDLTRYMQKLLDSGYYLVCSPDLTWLLKGLKYDNKTVVGETVVLGTLKNGTKP